MKCKKNLVKSNKLIDSEVNGGFFFFQDEVFFQVNNMFLERRSWLTELNIHTRQHAKNSKCQCKKNVSS